MKKDDLGNRMKEYYEARTSSYIPRRTNTIIRLDGKAFHSYCKGLKKPFDYDLVDDMIETTRFLCENTQGCVMGYVQSDEISLLLVDYKKLTTSAWFDGKIQKICSISSSMATAMFNNLRPDKLAFFDSRVFSIPEIEEVLNYFLWRQQDASRNSVSMVAQSLYSHTELHKKNTNEMQEMIFQKGINWNDLDFKVKRGTFIVKKPYTLNNGSKRTKWDILDDSPIISQNRELYKSIIDKYLNLS